MRQLLARLRSFGRGVLRPHSLAAEMDEEMRFHIEQEAERLARERGLGVREARRRAAVAFGGVEQRKEEGRDARGLAWLTGLSLDLKLAWRMLRKSPGLAIVGVLGIALGTAVGVGFFVVLSTFLYPTLPLEEGDRLVALQNRDVRARDEAPQSLHDFLSWREQLHAVEQVGAASLERRALVVGDGQAWPVRAAAMTAAGFAVARVPPLAGRYLLPGDERPGAAPVAVLGYDVWQARFAGNPRVLGRSVLLADTERVVVGIMPPGFTFPKDQELWTALQADAVRIPRGGGPELFVFGRLAPGVTRQQAQAELAALGARAAAEYPAINGRLRPRVLPFTYPLDDIEDVRLWEIAGIQLLVNLLVIAVAVNMAILTYARTVRRQAEMALRTALGASRRRIVGQLFVEALVLSGLGAGLGLVTALLVLRKVKQVMTNMPTVGTGFWVDYGLGPRPILYAAALAVLVAAIVGVVPALVSTGRRLTARISQLGSGNTVRLGRTWTVLIVAQVAVAVSVLPLALAIGVDSLKDLAVRATYPAQEILAARVGLALPLRRGMDVARYRREVAARLGDRLVELERRLEADPAVAGVTLVGSRPITQPLIEIEGVTGPAERGAHWIESTGVAANYFDVLGVHVLAGRGLRPSDAAEPAQAVVVTASFQQRYLRGSSAVGRRIRYVPSRQPGQPPEEVVPGPWLEIVGVVPDLVVGALDPDVTFPRTYYAVAPGQLQAATLFVRVRRDPAATAPSLRQVTATLDPDLRLGSVDNLARSEASPLLPTIVAAILLVVGTVTLLSAAGIHALMSLTVTRRRREIGIRTALGAQPARLLAGIFARAAGQLGLGGAVGAALAVALFAQAGDAVHSFPWVAAVLVIMLLAGLVAAASPASRGLRTQPMEALKEE